MCACVAMEKMTLFCGGMYHAGERGTTGESSVVGGTVAQASTGRRAGGGREGREREGRGKEGGECF